MSSVVFTDTPTNLSSEQKDCEMMRSVWIGRSVKIGVVALAFVAVITGAAFIILRAPQLFTPSIIKFVASTSIPMAYFGVSSFMSALGVAAGLVYLWKQNKNKSDCCCEETSGSSSSSYSPFVSPVRTPIPTKTPSPRSSFGDFSVTDLLSRLDNLENLS